MIRFLHYLICRLILGYAPHIHEWGKWKEGELIKTYSNNQSIRISGQKRECLKCGKVVTRELH